jgi:hypothetical protein
VRFLHCFAGLINIARESPAILAEVCRICDRGHDDLAAPFPSRAGGVPVMKLVNQDLRVAPTHCGGVWCLPAGSTFAVSLRDRIS